MPTGTLHVVATPIGNLKDITFRAIETLKGVDLIAAEDTRHTKILTAHYGITTPLTSYFEHNQVTKGEHLIGLLKEGRDIALVSDAGTPGISDPGAHIIGLAVKNGISVVGIPGPSAVIIGLVVSGMPTDRFIFEGFLPNKSSARRKRLSELKDEKRTVVLYESPHRISKTLSDILEIFGDIKLSVMRELTKKFEETLRCGAAEAVTHFEKTKPRGEFMIAFNPKEGARDA
jgi:16S rRNA (cytidine1402-2'-O)-methyltransferase